MITRPGFPIRRHSRYHLILATCAAATVIGGIGGCSTSSAARSTSPTEQTQTSAATASGQATGGANETGGAGVACNLVTAADVSTAFGEPMTQLGGSAADCAYANADHSQQLLVHEFLDQTNMSNLVQQLESSSEHVDGLGDDAFWNGTIDTMFVRKGNIGFTITSTSLGAKTPTDPDAPKAAMVTLATTALPNL